jgi:hypothetical protein
VNSRLEVPTESYQGWSEHPTNQKVSADHLFILLTLGIPRRAGLVAAIIATYGASSESISMNVGGSEQDDKTICPKPSEQARVAIGSISRLKAHTEATDDKGAKRKGSSLPMPVLSVGGVVVVRGRESRLHGEGPQSVGIPNHSNQV